MVKTAQNQVKFPDKATYEARLKDFKIAFGRRIKYYRDLRNYTQEYLAELVNIEQASLSNIERGKSHPTYETMFRLANALGVMPHQFYTIEPQISMQDMKTEVLQAMELDSSLVEPIYKFLCAVR